MNISTRFLNDTSLEDRFPPALAVSMAVILTMFCIATLACNAVFVTAVLRTTYLHTKTNALLVSIAGSEIILGLFVMPSAAAVLFKQKIQFLYSFCEFTAFMTSLSHSSKSLGILTVSVDRCIAVSHPLQYSSWVTKTSTTVFIISVWSISLLFAIFPLAGLGVYGFSHYYGRCMVDFDLSPVFAMVKELICTIIPALGIFVSLVIIISEARSHHRVTTIAQLAIRMYSGAAAMPGVKYSRSTYRAMRTFLIITLIYLLTCFPRSLFIVIVSGKKTRSLTAFYIVSYLTYICSVSTPLVITTLNIKFRQSIKTLLEARNKVKPMETETYTISTGLHSVLEASFVFKYVPHKDSLGHRVMKRRQSDEEFQNNSRAVRFQPRRVSVLNEVQSSSSGERNSVTIKTTHAPLRKTLSSPC